jgi:hypothetical protein
MGFRFIVKQMKKTKLLVFGAALCVALVVGCTSPSTTTYNTLSSVEATTSAAYTGYLSSVVHGIVPTNSVPVVSRDFNLFQAVMAATVAVAAQGSNAPVTTQVSAAASQVIVDITLATNVPAIK